MHGGNTPGPFLGRDITPVRPLADGLLKDRTGVLPGQDGGYPSPS